MSQFSLDSIVWRLDGIARRSNACGKVERALIEKAYWYGGKNRQTRPWAMGGNDISDFTERCGEDVILRCGEDG
jgi:hypothetical protein